MKKIYQVLVMICMHAYAMHALAIAPEKRVFVIVVPSYNNIQYVQENLDSLITQETDGTFEFCIVYCDDNSNDGTAEKVETYIQDHGCHDKIALIRNKTRLYALENIYNAIHLPWIKDNHIIILVDGDDKLQNTHVLLRLNKAYQDKNVWLTYGRFEDSYKRKGFCKPIPQEIIAKNAFRKYSWVSTHLKTFYAKLFRTIKKEDLLYQNKFPIVSSDRFFMYPLLELAGTHSLFIKDILYVYNIQNMINDFKVIPALQQAMLRYVLLKKPYQPLKTLF